ncbi:hypothetical protein L248_1198 [Schleiferilactobacillus shenzhenensis LY-73]|uniref:Uncharacterized protein n=1 Tax=Schleiferilactobacillus shenzhenensis LY-73 TaxID=1231336 RepID=U4TMJ4_9LACO|nr:hypothetical protein L248_1198 [Schleiferilactobacillus shenzhenensis LY-73]
MWPESYILSYCTKTESTMADYSWFKALRPEQPEFTPPEKGQDSD